MKKNGGGEKEGKEREKNREGGRGGRRTKGCDPNIFNVFIVLKSFLLQRLHSIKI